MIYATGEGPYSSGPQGSSTSKVGKQELLGPQHGTWTKGLARFHMTIRGISCSMHKYAVSIMSFWAHRTEHTFALSEDDRFCPCVPWNNRQVAFISEFRERTSIFARWWMVKRDSRAATTGSPWPSARRPRVMEPSAEGGKGGGSRIHRYCRASSPAMISPGAGQMRGRADKNVLERDAQSLNLAVLARPDGDAYPSIWADRCGATRMPMTGGLTFR